MFTKAQIKQLQELLDPIYNRLIALESGQKDLRGGVDEVRGGLEDLRGGVDEVKRKQQAQDKTLAYIKKRVNYNGKTLDIVARSYDERIVSVNRRIDHIEEHLNLPVKS